MSFTDDFFIHPEGAEKGFTVYLTAEDGVPDKVLYRLKEYFKEHPSEYLNMGIGGHSEFKSGYDNEWYRIYRKSDSTFIVSAVGR